MGYPVQDQAMRVVGSETRECNEKISPPSENAPQSQGVSRIGAASAFSGLVAMGLDWIGGRCANSVMKRSASAIPALLYPPEVSLTKGQTGAGE